MQPGSAQDDEREIDGDESGPAEAVQVRTVYCRTCHDADQVEGRTIRQRYTNPPE
jgi:hypothetical protein